MCWQEALAGLQGHLGCGQGGEVTAALQVLLALARSHPCLLLHHAALVFTLLDCLDTFTQAQLHQVNMSCCVIPLDSAMSRKDEREDGALYMCVCVHRGQLDVECQQRQLFTMAHVS